MKRLFIDDERNPIDCAAYMHRRGADVREYHQDWTVVRDYDSFVDYITKNGLPDIISFDHDLSDKQILNYEEFDDKEYNGMQCAKYLIDYCMDNNVKLPKYYVHSMNPSGVVNIKSILDNYKKHEDNQ